MISVCMATYNGEKYIEEQIISILNQLDKNDELIISDDLSTDKTIKKIQSLNDLRIRIYSNNIKLGYSKNFENALNQAKGEIIFLADQDDVWLPNKVAIVSKLLNKHDLVVHDAVVVNEDLNIIKKSYFEYKKVKKGFLRNFIQIKYLGCCMAFNVNVLKKALPFPNNQDLVTHDSWLSLISEMFFRVQLLHSPLIKYRRHENNTSLGGEKSTNSLLKKIQIRIYTIIQLAKKLIHLNV